MDGETERKVVSPPVLLTGFGFLQGEDLRADLEDLGLEVRLASTSEEALRWAKERIFCLAIFGARSSPELEGAIIAELRTFNPKTPLLMAGRSSRLSELRRRVLDLLGIAETDEPGSTLREG